MRRRIDPLRPAGIALFIAAICLAPLSASTTLLIAFVSALAAREPGLLGTLMPGTGKPAVLAALALLGLGAASAGWSTRPMATLEQVAVDVVKARQGSAQGAPV